MTKSLKKALLYACVLGIVAIAIGVWNFGASIWPMVLIGCGSAVALAAITALIINRAAEASVRRERLRKGTR
jgi:hypothetical protein